MARYYLGLDAGGTSTQALIADQSGQILGAGRSGCGNWELASLDGAAQALRQALAGALSSAGLMVGSLSGAAYSLAGLDWPSDEQRLGQIVERFGVPGPRLLVNDGYAALAAGAASGWGIALVLGSGGMVVGRNQRGQQFQAVSLGPKGGEYDGAGAFAARAQCAVAHAYMGRGPRTSLTERLIAWFGAVDSADLLERIARSERHYPDPAIAPLVFEEAESGDLVAQAIVQSVGDELGQTVRAIARRLELGDEPFELILSGGVLRSLSKELCRAMLEPVLQDQLRPQPIVLAIPPVVGSVLLALQAAGVRVTPAMRRRLSAHAAARLDSAERPAQTLAAGG